MTKNNLILPKDFHNDVINIVKNCKPVKDEDITITLYNMKIHNNIPNYIREECLFLSCYDNNKFEQAYRIAINRYSTSDGKKTIWDNLIEVIPYENNNNQIVDNIKSWFKENYEKNDLPSEEQSLANIKEVRERLNK